MRFHVPAALLLGPMAVGAAFSLLNRPVVVPRKVFLGAQTFIGCMIATSLTTELLGNFLQQWWLFVGITLMVLMMSTTLGYLLARWQVLPGTTAVWGSSPGGASVMVILAEAYGSDPALVAFMQYLRVVLVTLTAAVVAHLALPAPVAGGEHEIVWFPPLSANFGYTVLVAAVFGIVGYKLRVPGGPLIFTLFGATVINNLGWVKIETPEWLLAITYAIMGWRIGMGFTPTICRYAARAFPKLVISTTLLISLCACLALALIWGFHVDPLTAYLATSPGGLDSIAIIAASTKVQVGFVVTFQLARFLVVVACGPALAKWVAKRLPAAQSKSPAAGE